MNSTSSDNSAVVTDDHDSSPTSGVRVGTELGNKFRINRVLGQGGMGYVVHATHLHLDEPMALKFMHRELLAVPGIVRRFVQEARAASKLKSEHAVRVFDVGFTDDRLPYLVMEYLDGSDLAEVLRTRGPLSIEQAVGCASEACSALAEAHALGIVHRDVKCENLFWSQRSGRLPRVKILDFGISKFGLFGDSLWADCPGVPTTMGSPCYMSPEQLRSARDVDHRADIWSLGVVLYELLANELPFDPALPFEALSLAIQNQAPRPLKSFAPHVSDELWTVILRCLEKDPDRRYASAADVAHALRPFAPAEPTAHADEAAELPPSPVASPPAPSGSENFVHELTQRLAQRVGPFARVFIQKELRARGASAATLTPAVVEDLALRLATKIPTAQDRRLFLVEAADLVKRRWLG